MKTDLKIFNIPDFMIMMKTIGHINRGTSLSEIQTMSGITYSHLHHIRKGLVEKGMIDVVKKGRIQQITLTELGIEFVDIINKLLGCMEINDEMLLDYRKRTKHTKLENVEEDDSASYPVNASLDNTAATIDIGIPREEQIKETYPGVHLEEEDNENGIN